MSKFHYLIIICLILLSISSVYFFIPNNENSFAKTADEGYYLQFATIIAKKGISQFPSLVKSYAENTQLHLYPPPSRVGHIFLTALWLKFFGINFTILARFSFFCFLLFILVCFYYCRKFFDEDTAYLFVLLLSSSPLIMAMGKRALSDSNINLFWALSIWTFLDFLLTNKKSKFIIFLIIYSFSITIKESSVVLLIFFLAFLLIYKYYFRNFISNIYVFYLIFIPFFIVGIFYLILFGGWSNSLGLIRGLLDAHFGSVKLSQYAVLFCTGPWYRYIIDYLLLSPITTLLFIGYIGYILTTRKWNLKTIYFLVYFVIIFAIFSSLKYSKVVRFVINLDMVISLFSIFMLYTLFKNENKRKQTRLVFISAILIFFINYLNFIYLFCHLNIYDPITFWLLVAKRLIPT